MRSRSAAMVCSSFSTANRNGEVERERLNNTSLLVCNRTLHFNRLLVLHWLRHSLHVLFRGKATPVGADLVGGLDLVETFGDRFELDLLCAVLLLCGGVQVLLTLDGVRTEETLQGEQFKKKEKVGEAKPRGLPCVAC